MHHGLTLVTLVVLRYVCKRRSIIQWLYLWARFNALEVSFHGLSNALKLACKRLDNVIRRLSQ